MYADFLTHSAARNWSKPDPCTWPPPRLLGSVQNAHDDVYRQGNKQNNLTIIYTPASNVKKSGDMAVGTVTFHKERMIKRTLVPARENAIVNRVNKTRKEVRAREMRERERESQQVRTLTNAVILFRSKWTTKRKRWRAKKLRARSRRRKRPSGSRRKRK